MAGKHKQYVAMTNKHLRIFVGSLINCLNVITVHLLVCKLWRLLQTNRTMLGMSRENVSWEIRKGDNRSMLTLKIARLPRSRSQGPWRPRQKIRHGWSSCRRIVFDLKRFRLGRQLQNISNSSTPKENILFNPH